MSRFEPKIAEDDEDDIPLSRTRAELQEILDALDLIEERKKYRAKDFFEPYEKQIEFFDLGASKRERMLRAGNQLGKTEGGAFEMACHLTGEYPDWWFGLRFDHPVKAWAVGLTTQVTRDILQGKLCGEPGVAQALGSGMIPKECFAAEPTLARGITGAFDTVQVKHYTDGVYDGISVLKFKSAEQGREKFQSATLDLVWSDEEPPMDIYTELLARISATGGSIYTTFTPLQGRTELVERFEMSDSIRGMVRMKATDAKHMTPEKIADLLKIYPRHEHESRINGEPMQGTGRVFPYPDAALEEPAIYDVPFHWRKGWAIDFGVGGVTGHPFAAVLLLHDLDNDVVHVHAALKLTEGGPLAHAAAMKVIGINVPVSWPHDGHARESSGQSLASIYKAQGLRMQSDHAKFEDGGYSTEAGILEMDQRIQTGRLKVASHLSAWFEEFRGYHRKDGLIVKLRDDLMSATRIGIMDRRNFKLCTLGRQKDRQKRSGDMGIDFDPWTGQ